MAVITKLDTNSAKATWDKFILSIPSPVPFSFNPSYFDFYRVYFYWEPLYFLWYHEEKLIGLFPLVYTGKAFVSLPHFSYGGLLFKEPFSEMVSAIQQLVTVVDDERPGAGFYRYDSPSKELIENRNFQSTLFLRGLYPPGERPEIEKTVTYMELHGTVDELGLRLSSNLRRKIRKAEKSGIIFREGGKELLEDFYNVYVRKMHQLGSPAYGKGFFKTFFQQPLEEGSRFFVGYFDGRPVGGSLLLSYRGFFESAWFATDVLFQKYYISDGLHWSMIQYALKAGGRIYSMGRSTKNGSVFVYKNHWPVKNSPLFIYNTSNKPSVRDFAVLPKIWKYIPFPVAKRLGPKFVKHIY